MRQVARTAVWIILTVWQLPGQQPSRQADNGVVPTSPRPAYTLGPGDSVTIRALEVDEFNSRPFRIDSEGDLNLPILNKVHAAGLTVEQLEAELIQRLKTIVKSPQVSVTVAELRNEPVFVNGAFKSPGIYTLQGRRNLLEIITAAGGLQPNASRRIRVTRQFAMGPIPLPNTVVDPEKKIATVEISTAALLNSLNPQEDITLQPYDNISADQAEMVYASGEVIRAGGTELTGRDSLSVTQLISLVGGLGKEAQPEKARVLRQVFNTSKRAEIPVNLKRILAGQDMDLPLLPNDVLYVPRNSHGQVMSRIALIAVPMATAFIYVAVSRL